MKPARLAPRTGRPLEDLFRREQVGRIAQREPVTAFPQTTLGATLARLRGDSGGCVVIVEKWGERLKPVGVFTERDYLYKIAGRETVAASPRPGPPSAAAPRPPAGSGIAGDAAGSPGIEDLPVERFMTPAPTTLIADATLDRALQVMSSGGYRHLPLVDGEGQLAGILSVRDIIVYLAELFPTACINLPSANQPIGTREGE